MAPITRTGPPDERVALSHPERNFGTRQEPGGPRLPPSSPEVSPATGATRPLPWIRKSSTSPPALPLETHLDRPQEKAQPYQQPIKPQPSPEHITDRSPTRRSNYPAIAQSLHVDLSAQPSTSELNDRSSSRNVSSTHVHQTPSRASSVSSVIMSAAARAAGIADFDHINAANTSRDVEVGPIAQSIPRASMSRASLPLSRTRSFSTLGGRGRADSQGRRPSTAYGEGYEGANDDLEANGAAQEGEIPWGPSHPCFPHMNPHVSHASPLYEKTRIIRIKRDWLVAGDLAPAFSRVYPEILEPYLSEADFRELVDHINKTLLHAHDPWRPRAWVDAALGLLTGWVYDDLGLTGMKSDIRSLESWTEQWNESKGAKDGVKIIALRRTAFLSLDIQIPDPQIGTDATTDVASFVDGGSSMGTDSRFSRAAGSTAPPPAGSVYSHGDATAVFQDDQPAVPVIPGKYVDEAREAVGKQLQRNGAE